MELDKSYFPREKLFTDVNYIISSYITKGNYLDNSYENSNLSSFTNSKYEEIFPYLYASSLITNLDNINKLLSSILKNINISRKSQLFYYTDDIVGDLDVDEYIQINKLSKEIKTIYPCNSTYSTYQIPEYQYTLKCVDTLLQLSINTNKQLSMLIKYNYTDSIIEKKLKEYISILYKCKRKLTKTYGIKFTKKDTLKSLWDLVLNRYNTRKILDNTYIDLHDTLNSILTIKGIDMNNIYTRKIMSYNSSFDDRLFEIWCIDKIKNIIQSRFNIHDTDVITNPLHKNLDEPIFKLITPSFIYDLWFQNGTSIFERSNLEWTYTKPLSTERKPMYIIPDITLIKTNIKSNTSKKIIIDAKNRNWDLNSLGTVKDEVIKFIYIKENFKETEDFTGILISHNNTGHQFSYSHNKSNDNDVIGIASIYLNSLTQDFSFLDGFINNINL